MNTRASTVRLQPGDALVIVDLQNDFLPPDGALAVPAGREVIPVLNDYITLFHSNGLPVFATRDWHPSTHCSFKTRGGRWPVHCVIESPGAAFTSDLKLPPNAVTVSKSSAENQETYSAFEDTDFAGQLRAHNIKRVFVGGLATDYCVFHTSKDALQNGFETFFLRDASRAVNIQPDDGTKAEAELARLGARVIQIKNIGS